MMIKKALAAAVFAAAAMSAPAFAGSIGNIQSTTTTTITGGTRAITINGTYASEEHSVNASTDGTGGTASATWDPTSGPSLSTTGVGGAAINTASATYDTNAVTAGTYLNDQQHAYTGTESSTTSGVFFNY